MSGIDHAGAHWIVRCLSWRDRCASQAIGERLSAALAVALSPFPVIGIVLTLAGPHGRLNGPLSAAGWLVSLSVVTALVVVVLGGADDPNTTLSAIADGGCVLAGGTLIVLGVGKWRA